MELCQRSQQNLATLDPGGGSRAVLQCVHAQVGHPQRLGRAHSFGGEHDGAVGRRDREALSLLLHRAGGAELGVGFARRSRAPHRAELVTAEPVCRAVTLYCVRQAPSDALEQAVTGKVAEGVVVGLEAIEVE